MWQHLVFERLRADVLALEANAERAGYALGCVYTSTDEFEAAVIRSKRAAGLYGHRRWRSALAVGVAVVALALMIVMI
jgi:hypothetical protein